MFTKHWDAAIQSRGVALYMSNNSGNNAFISPTIANTLGIMRLLLSPTIANTKKANSAGQPQSDN
jgi:hypothetical protein